MIVLWLYRDLRLQDHPALTYAAKTGRDVIPLYIHDPDSEGDFAIGSASKWWLHYSLLSLQKKFKEAGSSLILRQGEPIKVFEQLLKEYPIEEVCWTKRYQPNLIKRDNQVASALNKKGVITTTHEGNYLINPQELLNKSFQPYKVFTPFYNASLKEWDPVKPLPVPKLTLKKRIPTLKVEELGLLPKIPWDKGIRKAWDPGSEGAQKLLFTFQKESAKEYGTLRDFPALEKTSHLSPHLAFGEVSPGEIWRACEVEPYRRQLFWREFGNYFLYHFPNSTNSSWRKNFEKFPWKKDKRALEKWQKGHTGYPFVDAAMRQLWETGWMHNRLRMVVGSFLVKDLMIHWIEGAKWFWDTLVDADLGNNTLGWQWVSGGGPDAAPYFRIFNPISQGEKFDEEGAFIKQYVPELSRLPKKWIHRPWEAPESVLQEAGVVLGDNYPYPMIDHKEARNIALSAYQSIK